MTMMTPDRFLLALRKTPVVLKAVLNGVTQARAQTARDGADGWNVLEIMCHLQDFEHIYYERARLIVETELPVFIRRDQNAMVIENRYAERQLAEAFADYLDTRRELVAYLKTLDEAQWQRCGVRSGAGEMTLLEHAMSISLHDVNHTEQMIRALGLGETLVE